jgi:FAD/FMN-containing dehydrogenase
MSESADSPSEQDWQRLAARIRGELLREPASARLAVGKQLAAGIALPQPKAVLRCASAADVQQGLAWLADSGLNFALRSGGHCFGDRSSSSGLVIDLGAINQIEIDGDCVELGPGALAGDLGLALAAHGRSLPMGGCPLVAIGGLSLIGGFGLQGRAQGLTSDRIERIDLVDAAGEIRHIDAATDPEWMWGLCGGGNLGFGVVTGLRLKTHSLPKVRVVFGQWPISQAADLIQRWQAYAPVAASGLTVELGLQAPDLPDEPANIELFGAIQSAHDDPAELSAIEAALRHALGSQASALCTFDLEGEAAARYLTGLFDRRCEEAWMPSRPYREHGYQFTRSHFHQQPIAPAAIAELIEHFVADRRYAEFRELELVPWGGAYAGANPHSCFGPRDASLLLRHTCVVGARSTAQGRELASIWAERSVATLAHGPRRPYAGYVEADRADWALACYGEALPRLRALKHRVDPHQRFEARALGF